MRGSTATTTAGTDGKFTVALSPAQIDGQTVSVTAGDAGGTVEAIMEANDITDDELMTCADAEMLAAKDPNHDWRIVLHGPLSGRTYQRHGPGRWMLVEKSEGFA